MCLSSLGKAFPSLHSIGLRLTSSVHVVEISVFFWGGADAICNAVAISSLSGGPGPYFKRYTN